MYFREITRAGNMPISTLNSQMEEVKKGRSERLQNMVKHYLHFRYSIGCFSIFLERFCIFFISGYIAKNNPCLLLVRHFRRLCPIHISIYTSAKFTETHIPTLLHNIQTSIWCSPGCMKPSRTLCKLIFLRYFLKKHINTLFV